MTTRIHKDPLQINPHKIAAALAQLGSFATTYGCVLALGGEGQFGVSR